FERATLDAGGFVLTRYLRAAPGAETLVVYLEGDGAAWYRDRLHVTIHPPPVHPFALRLAARDPAPAVAWLGRPCQPVTPADARGCEPSLWSHRRFSEPVVAALDEGLDDLRRETGATRLELVGYSGGGVLAALLAARRDDVVRLVTVAAPLDLDAWVAHHALGPLDAQNPARAVAPRLDTVAQTHLAGAADTTVPPSVVESYARERGVGRVEVVPGIRHGGWEDGWGERIAHIRGAP
ncbi:MAG TPA: alpha/beta hydrolase, partial [Myxococcota bacterium]|nr:alpha/beta hydrolase [Myxococcota bacterium]